MLAAASFFGLFHTTASDGSAQSLSSQLHTNTMLPFCWPNIGMYSYIGENLCIWEHTFHGSAAHKLSPDELPPAIFADSSSGTRLPTLRLTPEAIGGRHSATVQLAIRTDSTMPVPVSVLVAPPLTATVFGSTATNGSGVINVKAKQTRGVLIRVEADEGTKPGCVGAGV